MKKYTLYIFFLVFLACSICNAQQNLSPYGSFDGKKSKINYMEVGASVFKFNSALNINYFLGINSRKEVNSHWSNELYLYVNNRNNFNSSGFTNNYAFFSLGKGYQLKNKHFSLNPSLSIGPYYYSLRTFFGNEYDLGLQINPKLQFGFIYKNIKISLITNLSYGIGWINYVNNQGVNQNPGIKFPINWVGSLKPFISVSWFLQ